MKQAVANSPAILGIPYEEGAYWRKGSKHAPAAIIEELQKLRPLSVRTGGRLPYAIESLCVGSLELDPYNRDRDFIIIQESISHILRAHAAPISIGGDHSITIPILRALTAKFGRGNYCVIHIDAHSDTFPPVNDYNLHHGAVFRVAVEEGLIRPQDLVQLGMRGSVRDGGFDFIRRHNITSVTMEEWRQTGFSLERFIPKNYDRYYLSFDIDVVDPAFAPGTGTPVPGGLFSFEALRIIHEIQRYPLIGADFVEVAPAFDSCGITTALAAHLIFELLLNCHFVTTSPHEPQIREVANAHSILTSYQ